MYKYIKYEKKENIAYIVISRPEALNALNEDVISELYDVFNNVNEDENLQCAILTGEGKSFVAGADIAQMRDLSPCKARQMMTLGHKLMNYIENMKKPVIAAINGFALGGGCELAMSCDMRIASEKAKFGQPEVGLGIIPGFGGTQRLPRLVGKGMANYLIMTGQIIDAAEAHRIGLVEKTAAPEELLNVAEDVAKSILKNAPIAVSIAKSTINKGINMDMLSASQFEIEAITSTFGTEDQTEGMTAFLEKRKAEFKNK